MASAVSAENESSKITTDGHWRLHWQLENEVQGLEEGDAGWWHRWPIPSDHLRMKARVHLEMGTHGLLRQKQVVIMYKPRDINHFLV